MCQTETTQRQFGLGHACYFPSCTEAFLYLYVNNSTLKHSSNPTAAPLHRTWGRPPSLHCAKNWAEPPGTSRNIPSSLEHGPSPALLPSAPGLWEEQLQSLETHPGERLKEQPSRCSTRFPWQEGKASLAALTHSRRRAQLQHREIPAVHPAQGLSSGRSQLHRDSSKRGQKEQNGHK